MALVNKQQVYHRVHTLRLHDPFASLDLAKSALMLQGLVILSRDSRSFHHDWMNEWMQLTITFSWWNLTLLEDHIKKPNWGERRSRQNLVCLCFSTYEKVDLQQRRFVSWVGLVRGRICSILLCLLMSITSTLESWYWRNDNGGRTWGDGRRLFRCDRWRRCDIIAPCSSCEVWSLSWWLTFMYEYVVGKRGMELWTKTRTTQNHHDHSHSSEWKKHSIPPFTSIIIQKRTFLRDKQHLVVMKK